MAYQPPRGPHGNYDWNAFGGQGQPHQPRSSGPYSSGYHSTAQAPPAASYSYSYPQAGPSYPGPSGSRMPHAPRLAGPTDWREVDVVDEDAEDKEDWADEHREYVSPQSRAPPPPVFPRPRQGQLGSLIDRARSPAIERSKTPIGQRMRRPGGSGAERPARPRTPVGRAGTRPMPAAPSKGEGYLHPGAQATAHYSSYPPESPQNPSYRDFPGDYPQKHAKSSAKEGAYGEDNYSPPKNDYRGRRGAAAPSAYDRDDRYPGPSARFQPSGKLSEPRPVRKYDPREDEDRESAELLAQAAFRSFSLRDRPLVDDRDPSPHRRPKPGKKPASSLGAGAGPGGGLQLSFIGRPPVSANRADGPRPAVAPPMKTAQSAPAVLIEFPPRQRPVPQPKAPLAIPFLPPQAQGQPPSYPPYRSGPPPPPGGVYLDYSRFEPGRPPESDRPSLYEAGRSSTI
ncbi:hypothetical protein MIND_00568900 [Mycena indigotica]|uniref:Uncharacterized protein n=1 Tax=Mycena indigotica TaxID=2126181 RepID=A0A8H6SQX3_9AGAR|nr:uncharacterized protein MIND_00568900 [Mycena indigotica]KAF7303405.1 hypothetical protein MIND_00568900 [Mycena indigotica]